MDFLHSAWSWVCGIARTVWSGLTGIWDWVKNQVKNAWNVLKEKTPAFCELFTLKLFLKRARAKYDELCQKLSLSDRRELDDLINQIDAKN